MTCTMKSITGSVLKLSWICFILRIRVNEVYYGISFEAVLNLLHFTDTRNEVYYGIRFQAVLNLLQFTDYFLMNQSILCV